MTQSAGLFGGETGSDTASPAARKARGQQRSRPGRSLPTDRMKFEVQQRCLSMYGKLSGHGKKPVTAMQVSQAMSKEVSHYTVPLSNGFFVEAGWLEKRGKGEYAASDALIDYLRRLGTNREDLARAVQPLRDATLSAWFWQTIRTQLEWSGKVDESELLHVLMSDAEASADHLPQLRNLLEWMEYVGLIRRSDGSVYLTAADGMVNLDEVNQVSERSSKEVAAASIEPSAPATRAEAPTPAPVSVPTPTQSNAILSLDFSVRVTADDLAKLDPQQIQSLFAALGTVMSATGSSGT